MAIQGTDVKVQGDLRENGTFQTSMDSSSYASAVGSAQGVSGTGSAGGWLGIGAKPASTEATGAAGIKFEFKTKMDAAIKEYQDGINGEIDKMETNCSGIISKAFRGTEIEKAVNNLIVALKTEAMQYAAALASAEIQIVEEVGKAYQAQDTALGSSMNADTAAMASGGSNPVAP